MLQSPPALQKDKRASNQGKRGQKLIFICSVLSYLGNFGDRKGQNTKIFLKCGCKVGAGCGSACLPFGVSSGAGVQAFGAILLTLAKLDRIPPDALPFVRFAALLVEH